MRTGLYLHVRDFSNLACASKDDLEKCLKSSLKLFWIVGALRWDCFLRWIIFNL